MDFLSLALRSFDLDGAGPRLHGIDVATREVNGAAPCEDDAGMSRPSRLGIPMATAASDEIWLGAEAMIDPSCAALLRGAPIDPATAPDTDWIPL